MQYLVAMATEGLLPLIGVSWQQGKWQLLKCEEAYRYELCPSVAMAESTSKKHTSYIKEV